MNKVLLTGRLVKDPVKHQSTTGEDFGTFCLAVYRGKDETDFINCLAFGKCGELLLDYCKKGHLVGVEGRLQCRKYQDQFGQTKYIHEVLVANIDLLTSKSESEGIAAKENEKIQAEKEFDDIAKANSVMDDPSMPWNQ